MLYQFHISECTVVSPVVFRCITLPITSNFGGGYIKAYFIIVQPNIACHLGLLGILGFAMLKLHGTHT